MTALKEQAVAAGYQLPEEWIFQDEGCSGAVLTRPALEQLRDLVAEGQMDAVLVYPPDRLSRKYAYQVLLLEEFARHGVEVVFLRAPAGDSPEEQLVVQFQGMIAEYERAMNVERSRRGKRHRARQGSVNVLCGAPHGYRYVRKSDTAAASTKPPWCGKSSGCIPRKAAALRISSAGSMEARYPPRPLPGLGSLPLARGTPMW